MLTTRRRPGAIRAPLIVVTLAFVSAVLVGCAGSGSTSADPRPLTGTAGPSAVTGSAGSAAGRPATQPARPSTLVAVTSRGALVRLDPSTGRMIRVLRASGVAPDALALTSDGRTVYYELASGCQHQVWKVGTDGTDPTLIADAGSAPAISPDGTRLGYATQYFTCFPDNALSGYSVVVLDLATRSRRRYPMSPALVANGLPWPIQHLSWSHDGARLAVSIAAPEDNEGQQVITMRPSVDTYYIGGGGSGVLPLTAAESKADYFFSEGVFLPNGRLFVVRQCCGGDPINTTSVRLQEVDPTTGAPVHQVAVGATDQTHTSLDVDATGRWLLYLSGANLEISLDGTRPTTLTSGYLAAAW
ncbi:MAG: TolB family protein [Frankia sp.]